MCRMAFSQFRRFSRNQLLFGGLFRKEIIIRFPRPRDLEVYRVFVMALPANAEESGLAEGMHLESKNDNATESKCTWQAMLRGSTNKYVGYVKSVEEAMAVLREYELETTSKFSCFKSDKMFGAGDPFARQRKVYFKDDKIPFDGVPFSIIATKVFDCQHGPDRKKSFKAKHAENKIDDHSFTRKRFLPQDTMKFGCPASIRLSEVVKYYNYKIRENTERLRRDMSKKLKTDITDGQKPEFERRIYIQLPKGDEHRDHIIGKVGGILQPIDKRLVHKIGELVGEGVKTVDEMKRHLRQFVKTELFPEQTPPSSTNRRYYPTDVDVRNHMYQASVKKLLSKTDQENISQENIGKHYLTSFPTLGSILILELCSFGTLFMSVSNGRHIFFRHKSTS